MRRVFPVSFVLALPLLLPATALAADDLASAKAQYASASYEEALETLASIEGPKDVQIDQYRALCFLALGRNGEAEQAVQQLVQNNPLYVVTGSEVSPKLVELFEVVRKRTLPSVALELYVKAKGSYDAGRLDLARTQFRELMEVVASPAMDLQAPGLTDMRVLADGFLKLTEAEIERSRPKPAPPAATAAAASIVDTRRIYSAKDAGIVAPAEIEKRLPVWAPPASARRVELRGVLLVVINERGTVESAKLDRPLSPYYDSLLLTAAKTWRFRPATKDGRAVKYQREVEIVLRPPD